MKFSTVIIILGCILCLCSCGRDSESEARLHAIDALSRPEIHGAMEALRSPWNGGLQPPPRAAQGNFPDQSPMEPWKHCAAHGTEASSLRPSGSKQPSR